MSKTRVALLATAVAGAIAVTTSLNGADRTSWSYKVIGDREKTVRSYLLVPGPNTRGAGQIHVRSTCTKAAAGEGAYGECKHTVTLQPSGRRLHFTTGEDVVLPILGRQQPLLLATLEYGCCAGPWTARFYDSGGHFLGLTRGYDESAGAIGHNVITRGYDFHNAARTEDGTFYLLVSPESQQVMLDHLTVVILKNDHRTTLPINLPLPSETECEEWVVARFVAYADRSDITLSLEGVFCSAETVIKDFSCALRNGVLECRPTGASTPN